MPVAPTLAGAYHRQMKLRERSGWRYGAMLAALAPISCTTAVQGGDGTGGKGGSGSGPSSARASTGGPASSTSTAGTGGSSGTATGGAGGAPTAASTGGGSASYPDCLEVDPEAQAEFTFDLAVWDPLTRNASFEVTLDTACVVESLSTDSRTTTLSLLCTHDKRGDVGIGASFAMPQDVQLPLSPGGPIWLSYYGHGIRGERGPGAYFALRDRPGAAPTVAGIHEEYAQAVVEWSGPLAPWAASVDTSICPKVCFDPAKDCPQTQFSQRQGITLGPSDGRRTFLDGSRSTLETGGRTYDVVVPVAGGEVQVTEIFKYRALAVQRPI